MSKTSQQKISEMVEGLLGSYEEHPIICNIDSENQINRDVILEILDMLRWLIYPGYFEMRKLKSSSIEYHVGEILESVRYNLTKQVMKALYHDSKYQTEDADEAYAQAECIVTRFLYKLPKVREVLATDVQAAYDGDPAAFNTDEVIFSYPGVYAVSVNRIAHELYQMGVPLIPRMMTEHAHGLTGIDIHPGATRGIFFHRPRHRSGSRGNDDDREECKAVSGRNAGRAFHQGRPGAARHEAPPDDSGQCDGLFRGVYSGRRNRDWRGRRNRK